MENPYFIQNVLMPDWMKNFRCLAEKCPQTCCQGWNIPVDPSHAAFYQSLPDIELREKTQRAIRVVSRKQGKKTETLRFLNLLAQPDQACMLLTDAGNCSLQESLGAFALCDTCFFFPREFWRIGNCWSMSASLSCPEVRTLGLARQQPITFSLIETLVDPDADWIDLDSIPNPEIQFILNNRQSILLTLLSRLQNREIPFEEALAIMCSALNNLSDISSSEEISQALITGNALGMEHFSNVAYPVQSEKFAAAVKWFEVLDGSLNWGLENAAKSAQAINQDLTRLIAGSENIYNRMAENYLVFRDGTLEDFISKNRHLFENFMAMCLFSDLFRQYPACQSKDATVPGIIRFEICRICIIYSLLKVQLANEFWSGSALSEEGFLKTAGEMDRSYLHYPDFLNFAAERLSQTDFSNQQLNQTLSI